MSLRVARGGWGGKEGMQGRVVAGRAGPVEQRRVHEAATERGSPTGTQGGLRVGRQMQRIGMQGLAAAGGG